jgi:hypothetical protein
LSTWESSDAGAAWQLIENPNVSVDEVEPSVPTVPIDYTPTHTGTRTRTDRYVSSISVNDEILEFTAEQQNRAYLDVTDEKTFAVAGGEEISFEVLPVAGVWMNGFVYIDEDKDGFTAGVASDGYTPTGDLVSYSFYNNGDVSDGLGWNSAGESLEGEARNTLELPNFTAPSVPGTYRLRFKFDWCNIDPAGSEGTYFTNTFMGHGGQIIDVMLLVRGIALDKTTATLVEGATLALNASVIPADEETESIEWSTSDAAVATVDESGLVTAISAGTATITAKAGELTATCEVTVERAFVAVEEITLDQTTATLVEGETMTSVAA